MADIYLRSGPSGLGVPLSIEQMDSNFTNLNNALGDKLNSNDFTASNILTLIKTVDGTGSGLDADTLDGLQPGVSNVGGTIVQRNASGNFSAGVITAVTFDGNSQGTHTGAVNLNTGALTNGSASVTTLTASGNTTLSNTLTVNSSVGSTSQYLRSRGAGLSPTWDTPVTSFSAGSTGLTPSTATTGAVTLGGKLDIAYGGTNATSASGARTNLGAAASGSNSDITSLSGLTTALSVAQGGTGVKTLAANNVLLGNGTSGFQVVAPGSENNILKSDGSTWVSGTLPVAAGTVVQVQTATSGPARQIISSTSPVAVTGLSISFTPKYSNSKIVIMGQISTNACHVASFGIFKDGAATVSTSGQTNNNEPNMQITSYIGTSTTDYILSLPIMHSETSGSTTARTYAIYGTSGWSGSTYSLQINNRNSNDMASFSYMTIMEVAQ